MVLSLFIVFFVGDRHCPNQGHRKWGRAGEGRGTGMGRPHLRPARAQHPSPAAGVGSERGLAGPRLPLPVVNEPLLASPNLLRTKPPCNGVFFFFLLFISASPARSDLDVLSRTAMVGPPSAAIGDWVDSSSSFSPPPFPHCSFTKVTCDAGSWVVSLNITSVGLLGYIPPEIGLLRDLVNLTLTTDNLTGTLPPELGSPTSLRFLNLSGIFPSKVLRAITQLKELHLGNDTS
ncbi:hypothetical protein EUGRSUZ_D00508 [Eucalyptus grandis]|uniref:Uncharacterized protein n=2 Tax=Eucalyptus grandis TaxID=71139 RepID=A0ACC3L364_EUCGR|nr:hypothetical protein EUGRSUZ_D00508 [Eucalyptus grandis]